MYHMHYPFTCFVFIKLHAIIIPQPPLNCLKTIQSNKQVTFISQAFPYTVLQLLAFALLITRAPPSYIQAQHYSATFSSLLFINSFT